MELYLRKANKLDKKLTYNWFNDKQARLNSFSMSETTYENHVAWFEKTLASEERDLFICMDFMMPVGEIRLDYTSEDNAVISYMVDEKARGEGYGRKMLRLVEKEALKKYPTGVTLYGEVKCENLASIRTFENAGYSKSELTNDERIVFEKHVTAESIKNSPKSDKKTRDANFEILRVIAMLMVITLHYIGKGGLIAPLSQEIKSSELPFWIIESLCIVCVNVYVLITGYYMVDSKFKLSKLVALWCQVLFYSIVVALVSVVAGINSFTDVVVLYKQFILLPVSTGHYWFATAYIVMYIFSPVLIKAMRAMDQRTHRLLIFLLLIPMCFAKSIIPYNLATDDSGVTFVWFLVLFVIAGYIRIYGIKFFDKKINCILAYVGSVAGILIYRSLATVVAGFVPSIDLYTRVTDYNFVFVLTGSLGLFCLFKNIKFKQGFIVRYLAKIAPYTFGIYLLHEHICMRFSWLVTLKVSDNYGSMRIFHMILSVLIVFTVGILVDFVRNIIFAGIRKVMIWALKIYYSYREVMDYLIFGVLATIVNWVAYISCAYCFLRVLMEPGSTALSMTSNVIAWVAAVLFAYWTNRNFVFRSEVTGFVPRLKEFWQFVAARIFSFLVETLMFFVMIDVLKMNDLISKAVISVVVIVLNYIFSKLWVFGNKKKVNDESSAGDKA